MQWNDDKYQVQYMKVRVAFRGTFPPQEAKSSAFIEITQPPQARVKMPEETSQMTHYNILKESSIRVKQKIWIFGSTKIQKDLEISLQIKLEIQTVGIFHSAVMACCYRICKLKPDIWGRCHFCSSYPLQNFNMSPGTSKREHSPQASAIHSNTVWSAYLHL